MKSFDVIVVGVGTMGAATCYHLAKRGVSVLGLEQHALPHQLGAHHGFSRIIRLAYYEHPDYVPLLRRAYDLWDDLATESGQTVLHRTGGLYIGLKGEAFLEGALASARAHGLAHRLLSPAEIRDRYPMFEVPDTHEGFFEEAAGFLVPESVMAAHLDQALRHGATLRGHTRIDGWEADGNGVVVQAQGERFRARRLVITAGAWTSRILADLDLGLSVTRQTWGWFWPERPDDFSLGKFPCWFLETPDSGGHYGFPMMPTDPGFKVARHVPSNLAGSPDTLPREITPEDEGALRTFLERNLPQANGDLLAIRTCLYTNSPDGHFIVDRHPRCEHVHFACGFSGHGFKFGSVMGEVLADLATRDSTDHPIGFLSLRRFG